MKNKKIIGIILSMVIYLSMFVFLFSRLFNIGSNLSIKGINIDNLIIAFWCIIGLWAFISEYIEARKHKYHIAEKDKYNYYLLNSLKMLVICIILLCFFIGGYYNIYFSFFTIVAIIGIIVSLIIIPIIQKIISKK